MHNSLHPPRGMIFDLDGVLWRSNQPIGDLVKIFSLISQYGIKVVLATNNSTLSIADYQKKLSRFGVSIAQDQIINSAQATAYALGKMHPGGGKIYVVGENGIHAAMEESGFSHSEEPGVLAVVAGLDRDFTYAKLKHANALIRAGAQFWGTNPDLTFPTPDGLTPGAGSILAAIEAASGVKPMIAGKPAGSMFNLALERLGTAAADTMMVGDRLDTDIAGARQVNLRTALVLTGVTTLQEALGCLQKPDVIVPDLTTLITNFNDVTVQPNGYIYPGLVE